MILLQWDVKENFPSKDSFEGHGTLKSLLSFIMQKKVNNFSLPRTKECYNSLKFDSFPPWNRLKAVVVMIVELVNEAR